MSARRLPAFALVALAGCGRHDPLDDPAYAAACHGPPIETIEERQSAFEQGYVVNNKFQCIDKSSWEEAERSKAMVADMLAKAEREAQAEAAARPKNLDDARRGFQTKLGAPASGQPLPAPPRELFVRADYTGGEGRTLAAFVTPDPRDGQRHAAVVWITGGDSSSLGDFWTPGAPR